MKTLTFLLIAHGAFAQEVVDAAKRSDSARIRSLLESGTDVDSANARGFTALMEAARRGDVDLVKLLLTSGADVNASSQASWGALSLAASNGHVGVVVAPVAIGK